MADYGINQPNITGSRRFRTYLNQYTATSGRRPSAALLDQIIQGELDAASNRSLQSRQLRMQQEQFDINQRNAMDTASANRKAGLISTGAQTLTTGATLAALTHGKLWGTKTPASGIGSSTLNAGSGIEGASVSTGAPTLESIEAGGSLALPEATAAAPEVVAPASSAGSLTTAAAPTVAGGSTLTAGGIGGGATVAEGTTLGSGGLALSEGGLAGDASAISLSGEAAVPAATPALAYVAPAAAGYVAPKLLNAIHKDSTENIGHAVGIGKIVGGEKDARVFGSAAVGAGAGFAIGGPIGAAVGGVVGAVSELFGW